MTIEFERALSILKTLVEAAGGSILPVQDVLSKPKDYNVPRVVREQLEVLQYKAIDGFFHCAAKDIIFTDVNRISRFYGRGLEQAYPRASLTFMKLARTYWTFKVVFNECLLDDSLCVSLLAAIDINFCGLFFPTPGPFGPPREQRMIAMRTLIEGSGADLDVEDYLCSNPYLS
jgi:hypothetical protein